MKFRLTIFLSLILLATSFNQAVAAQTSFDDFWKNFKASVVKGDKTAVAALAKFPTEMPYGIKSVKTKADFLKRYKEIFNGEADAAKCFAKAKPEKEDAKHYAVYCGFKQTPNDTENTPIKYAFELTKTGWKFVGLDNINE
jgi:hypothetical protein